MGAHRSAFQLQQPPAADEIAYRRPARRTIHEIAIIAAADPSVRLHFERLVGNVEDVVFWPDDPNTLIVRNMRMQVRQGDIGIDVEDQIPVLREGAEYRLMITFNVQREIVLGLTLRNTVLGRCIEEHMLGSYGPRRENYVYTSDYQMWDNEEFIRRIGRNRVIYSTGSTRGLFIMQSVLVDDDRNQLHFHDWVLEVAFIEG